MKTKTKLLLGLGFASAAAIAIPTTVVLTSCSDSGSNTTSVNMEVFSKILSAFSGQTANNPTNPLEQPKVEQNTFVFTATNNTEKFFMMYLPSSAYSEMLPDIPADFGLPSSKDKNPDLSKMPKSSYQIDGTVDGWEIKSVEQTQGNIKYNLYTLSNSKEATTDTTIPIKGSITNSSGTTYTFTFSIKFVLAK